jgi:uncharacterized protein YjiS (DUF1127 family)
MEKLFKKLIKRWKVHSHFSRTVRELNHLSDRDLADLGIARTDIYRVARQTSIRRALAN